MVGLKKPKISFTLTSIFTTVFTPGPRYTNVKKMLIKKKIHHYVLDSCNTWQHLCIRILRMKILFKNNKKQIFHYFIIMINFQNQNQGYKLIVTNVDNLLIQ